MKIMGPKDTFDKEFIEFLEARRTSYHRLRTKYHVSDVKGIYFISANNEQFLMYEADLKRILQQWRSAYE